MTKETNRRILLVDDNASIHADYKKILAGASSEATADLDSLADAFFGEEEAAERGEVYECESAMQGEEALALLVDARRRGKPFAVAFIDVRMPPGWDGITTLSKLWEEDPELQAVLCTAFSDYSYEQMLSKLGRSQNLLILKKPFDPVEVQQLASALTQKWSVTLSERLNMEQIQAYASSLETVNRALASDKAMAEEFARTRGELAVGAAATLADAAAGLDAWLRSGAAGPAADALRLVTRTADVARLLDFEFGTPRPERTDVDVAAWLAACRSRARAAGVGFDVALAGRVPARIQGDPRLFDVLVDALVGATLAAGGDRIRVSVSLGESMAGAPLLQLACTLGGANADFSRLDLGYEAFTPAARGLDLGIAVARACCRALGADLSTEAGREHELTVAARLDPGALDGATWLDPDGALGRAA